MYFLFVVDLNLNCICYAEVTKLIQSIEIFFIVFNNCPYSYLTFVHFWAEGLQVSKCIHLGGKAERTHLDIGATCKFLNPRTPN